MKVSPRNRLIIVAVAALLLVVVLVVALILPAVRQISVAQGQIEAAEASAQSASLLLEQRRQIKDRAAATDAQFLALAVAVPENPDLPDLIIELQDLAFDSGVLLSSIQPGDPVATPPAVHVAIPVTLKVAGPWADVVDYLQQLRRVPRQLRVNDVVVTVAPVPSEAQVAQGIGISVPPYYQVNADIILTAYVIPETADASPSAPPPAPVP